MTVRGSMEILMRAVLASLVFLSVARAEEPPAAAVNALKDLLVAKVPTPAIDTKHNWGHQKEFVTGYYLKRRGRFDWDGRPTKELKNDGHWTHLQVTLPDAAKNVTLEIKDLKLVSAGRTTFSAAIRSAKVNASIKQQLWKGGVRVFSNETRLTCKAAVHLDCEVVQRFDVKPGAALPDLVLKLQVHKAEVFNDDLMVEHTLGVGGDAAKLIGEAAHKLLTQIKPSVERDLLAKANAAVVKAANDKEVRLGLSNLVKK